MSRRAFTLIELLVVISIIAILAAMLLTAISGVKKKVLVRRANLEIGQIVQAINKYEADYGRLPMSKEAISAATLTSDDFTYGTAGLSPFKTPTSTATVPSPLGSGYQANNSEVMAVLLDLERYGNGTPTVNLAHVKNPQQHGYLNATLVGSTTSPGVGLDGVYRDPWGQPYIITLDLNNDGKCRDAFYSATAVSALDPNNTSAGGVNGLIPTTVSGNIFFEGNSQVMVWSAGPDKMVDPAVRANAGANKDNIVSWK